MISSSGVSAKPFRTGTFVSGAEAYSGYDGWGSQHSYMPEVEGCQHELCSLSGVPSLPTLLIFMGNSHVVVSTNSGTPFRPTHIMPPMMGNPKHQHLILGNPYET